MSARRNNAEPSSYATKGVSESSPYIHRSEVDIAQPGINSQRIPAIPRKKMLTVSQPYHQVGSQTTGMLEKNSFLFVHKLTTEYTSLFSINLSTVFH